MGGMVAAIERGFPQREIQEAAFRFQQAVERKEKVIVGRQRVRDGGEAASRSSTSTRRSADEQVARVARAAGEPRRRAGGRAPSRA